MAKDPFEGQTVPTEEMAKELSKILGCSGAHKVGDDAWGPCESPKDLKKPIRVAILLFVSGRSGKSSRKTLRLFRVEIEGER